MSVKKRLYNDVARRLIEWIDGGQFPPGSRLPGERDLADQFGVSRVTVREALIALQAQERIEVRTGSGAKVLSARPKPSELPDVDTFELTQARLMFEGEAAALAATMMTDEELAELDRLLAEMAGASRFDLNRHVQVDRDFHMTIARGSKNAVVADTVERLWRFRMENQVVRLDYETLCGLASDTSIDEHRAVAVALRSRDPVAARSAMTRHFKNIIEMMLSSAEERAIAEARRRTDEARQRFLTGSSVLQ